MNTNVSTLEVIKWIDSAVVCETRDSVGAWMERGIK
jgi:hypothetical protein